MIELDKRILDGKRPLTCFEANQAKFFLGEKCYLTNDISIFANLNKFIEEEKSSNVTYDGVIDTLENIGTELSMPFETARLRWKFCIPCEWVQPEKKYRPFSIEDWKFKHSFGDTILYRYKGTYCGGHREVETMYLGYVKQLNGITDEAGKGELILGDGCHELQNLFDNYEMWVDGGWKPFGIEVMDGE